MMFFRFQQPDQLWFWNEKKVGGWFQTSQHPSYSELKSFINLVKDVYAA